MTKYLFANNATSFLAIDTGSGSSTLSLMAGEGERFPQPVGDGSDAFAVTIEDRRNQTLEICLCTGRNTDILQVQRAQEGTEALLFKRGSTVSVRLTAAQLDYMRAIVDGAGDKYTKTEADARFVDAAGDVMTGALSIPPPTDSTHAVNKDYTDTTYAPVVHTHTIPQVTGLQAQQDAQDTAIATKEPIIAPGGGDQFWRGDKTWQPIASVQVDAYDKSTSDDRFINTSGDTMMGPLTLAGDPLQPLQAATKSYVDANIGAPDWSDITNKPTTFPPAAHTHVPAEVVGLQSLLDGKADVVHTHTISQVTGLTAALAGKEPSLPAGGTTSTFLRGDKTWQPVAGGVNEAPGDGKWYVRGGSATPSWGAMTTPVSAPPNDSQMYGLKNGAWQVVTSSGGGGGGIPEAPADGRVYNRRGSDETWQPASAGGSGFDPAADYQVTGLWTFGPCSGLGGSAQIKLASQQAVDQTGNATTSLFLDNAAIYSDWTQNDLTIMSPLGDALYFSADGSDELRWRGKALVREADKDGLIYGRQDGGWVEIVSGGGGGGIPEAPTDGDIYLRRGSDGSWQASSTMTVAWAAITGKPATFPPTLPIAQSGITNLTTDLSAKLDKAGGTMTGALTLIASVTGGNQATTKNYVDNAVATREPLISAGSAGQYWDGTKSWVALPSSGISEAPTDGNAYLRRGSTGTWTSGGTLTGALTLGMDPVLSMHAVTLQYLTNKYLPLAGGALGGALTIPDGAASTPNLNFAGSNNSGLYYGGGVNVAVGGAAKMLIASTAITPTVPFKAFDGSVTAAAYAFNSNANLGMYRIGADQLGFTAAGVLRLTVSTTALTSTLPVVLPADPTTGLQAATKQYVDGKAIDAYTKAQTDTLLLAKAPLASPVFTGDPQAPTPTAGDNDTSIATTAFVTAAIAAIPPPSSGGVTISDTPPASPTDGQQWFESDSGAMFIRFNDGSSTQWVQTNGAGIADAPADGGEYVRVNGVWRLKSQTLVLDGLAQVDVDVPVGAKLLRAEGMIWWSATSANNAMTWRASTDGTTFQAGASDYFYGGLIHYNGTAAYANLVATNEAYGRLSFPGDTTTQPVRFRWLFPVLKSTNANALHVGTVTAGYYNTPTSNAYTDAQFTSGVQTSTNLSIKKLRFFNGPVGSVFGNASYVVCEWLY